LEQKTRRVSLLSRIALVGAATIVAVAIGSPAWANSTINILSGNVPTTAAGFKTHTCDPNLGGGPFPTQDVWVFNLPDQGVDLGVFVSITAHFTGHPDQTIDSTINPTQFHNSPGTPKAWMFTPAGWELTGASAVITDPGSHATGQTFFVLTHTCPAETPPTTPPATTPPVDQTTPPVDQTTPPGDGTSPPRTEPGTPSGGVSSGGGGSQSNGGLFFGLTALAVATAAGGVLFLAWRRRNSA
jgi:hypothetical protein